MAIISSIIPKSGFEIVRDQICSILLIELTNQKNLQGLAFPEDFDVLPESLIPTDSADKVTINVLLDSASYTGSTQKDAMGATSYFIDVTTVGEDGDGNSGSQNSAFLRDKFVAMIGYIFRSAYYRTMGLPAGTVGNVTVESFATLDPYKKEDSDFTTFARLRLSVRIYENSDAWGTVQLIGTNTTVKLDLTDKGYKFVFNN